MEAASLIWRKSSRSGTGNGGGNQDCVEVALAPGHVFVRDSKDPSGPRLNFAQDDWQAFLDRLAQP